MPGRRAPMLQWPSVGSGGNDPAIQGTGVGRSSERAPRLRREGPGRTTPLRPGTTASLRRRDVEAGLIGIPPGPGPDWWTPCWEHGITGDLPADVRFDALAGYRPDVRILHDVEVEGTRTTIDHVLIGSGGVVVAGTKTCSGKVRTDGVHLRVRGRDRSTVVDVALWRAEAVRATLARRGLGDLPVHGVLHWEHVEAPGDRPICLRGVPLLSAGATFGMAATGIGLSPLTVERVASVLAGETLH